MCRLLGIVADAPAKFSFCLREAPRSLGFLSKEHPDGWGIAVHQEASGWAIKKQPVSAFADPHFGEAAGESRGTTLLAHVRRRTVGPVSLDNTHPFQRGRWVFAHNGTIEDVPRVRAAVSSVRLAEVRGTTDSEVFFAYLLTELDKLGEMPGEPLIDTCISTSVARMASDPSSGAVNFLLSDGDTLFAFRRGRTLHVLERSADDEPSSSLPSSRTGTVMETTYRPRQRAILVASEQITDEPWTLVAEGTLLKVKRTPHPIVTVLATL
jgi:predicted glutamine amidotransferase